MHHFLDIHRTDPKALRSMIDAALAMKAARAGRPKGEADAVQPLAGRMVGRVLCALADTGVLPVVSAVTRFRDDFVRAIENGGDPRPEPMMEVAVGG